MEIWFTPHSFPCFSFFFLGHLFNGMDVLSHNLHIFIHMLLCILQVSNAPVTFTLCSNDFGLASSFALHVFVIRNLSTPVDIESISSPALLYALLLLPFSSPFTKHVLPNQLNGNALQTNFTRKYGAKIQGKSLEEINFFACFLL